MNICDEGEIYNLTVDPDKQDSEQKSHQLISNSTLELSSLNNSCSSNVNNQTQRQILLSSSNPSSVGLALVYVVLESVGLACGGSGEQELKKKGIKQQNQSNNEGLKKKRKRQTEQQFNLLETDKSGEGRKRRRIEYNNEDKKEQEKENNIEQLSEIMELNDDMFDKEWITNIQNSKERKDSYIFRKRRIQSLNNFSITSLPQGQNINFQDNNNKQDKFTSNQIFNQNNQSNFAEGDESNKNPLFSLNNLCETLNVAQSTVYQHIRIIRMLLYSYSQKHYPMLARDEESFRRNCSWLLDQFVAQQQFKKNPDDQVDKQIDDDNNLNNQRSSDQIQIVYSAYSKPVSFLSSIFTPNNHDPSQSSYSLLPEPNIEVNVKLNQHSFANSSQSQSNIIESFITKQDTKLDDVNDIDTSQQIMTEDEKLLKSLLCEIKQQMHK